LNNGTPKNKKRNKNKRGTPRNGTKIKGEPPVVITKGLKIRGRNTKTVVNMHYFTLVVI
jgi:hypothetical protein